MTVTHETCELLAEHTRDIIWAIDPHSFRLLYVNRAIQDFLGVTAEEAARCTLPGVMPTESMVAAVQELSQAIAKHLRAHRPRSHFTRIIEHRHRNGRRVWGESSISLIGRSAAKLRVVGITRDVTDQTRSKRRRATCNTQLRAIQEGVPVIMLLLDRAHRCRQLNRRAEAFLQTTEAAARGQPLCSLLCCAGPGGASPASPPRDCTHCALSHALRRAAEGTSTPRVEVALELLRDGTPRRHVLHASVISLPADRHRRILLCLEDITARQPHVEKAPPTGRLEVFAQLAGGIVHDFNNILAAVVLHLGLLKNRLETDAHLRRELGELEDEIRAGSALARQLLLFCRGETPRPMPVDVNAVIAHALQLLRHLLGAKIRVERPRVAGLPRVLGDAGMIEQVIVNLCLNARDAMPQGGTLSLQAIPLECRAVLHGHPPTPRTGRFVQLSVSDTGCGMDAPVLQRIFEPFFTTKSPDHGSGIGLAAVQAIVEYHQGWIEVRSQPGAGTTFDVGLPVADGPASLG